jgi:hypothetical protein
VHEEDETYLDRLRFSDEPTFHACGTINRYNCHIWGSENPHGVTEHECDSPKTTAWYTLMKNKDIGPFFFAEPTLTGETFWL